VTLAVLCGVFLLLLLLRLPVAFCIGLSALSAMLCSLPFEPSVMTIAQRTATGVTSFTLLAIPLFVLAGRLISSGGMAMRLIDFARVSVGFLPGGLAMTSVLANTLFGSVSGSAAAAASGIGSFMIPAMEKEGYPRPFGAAVTVSSATTGLLIPPSNVLIVYAMVAGGVSIGALFVAGYLPGILLSLALMVAAMLIAWRSGFGIRGPVPTAREFFEALLGVVPALLLIVLVIGGIVGGIFTATEASAVAVLYSFALAVWVYKAIGWRELPTILLETAATTGMVFLLIGTSMAMAWIFAYANVPQLADGFLRNVSANPYVILLLINLILLGVGTFMDMTPAVLIFTPIFLPIVQDLAPGLGSTPELMKYQFGIIMVFNLSIGLCTPPVGTVLFIGAGVAKLPIARVARALIPFFVVMVFALVFVMYVPALSLWLPRDIFALVK